jgi:hypothetical protein
VKTKTNILRRVVCAILGAIIALTFRMPEGEANSSSGTSVISSEKIVDIIENDVGSGHGKNLSDIAQLEPAKTAEILNLFLALENTYKNNGLEAAYAEIANFPYEWKSKLCRRLFWLAGLEDAETAIKFLANQENTQLRLQIPELKRTIWAAQGAANPSETILSALGSDMQGAGNSAKIQSVLAEWASRDFDEAKRFVIAQKLPNPNAYLKQIAVAALQRNPREYLKAEDKKWLATIIPDLCRPRTGSQTFYDSYKNFRDGASMGQLLAEDIGKAENAWLKDSANVKLLPIYFQGQLEAGSVTLEKFLVSSWSVTSKIDSFRSLLRLPAEKSMQLFDGIISQSLPAERVILKSAFYKQLSESDPISALSFLEQNPDVLEKSGISFGLMQLGNRLISYNPELALSADSLAKIPPTMRAEYAQRIQDSLSFQRPHLALDLLRSGDLSDISKSAASIILRNVSTNGVENVIKNLPPLEALNMSREEAVSYSVEGWAGAEPIAASMWVDKLEPGMTKDHAILGLVRSIEAADPDSAKIWIGSINDPATRNAAREIIERRSRGTSLK